MSDRKKVEVLAEELYDVFIATRNAIAAESPGMLRILIRFQDTDALTKKCFEAMAEKALQKLK